MSEKWEFPPFAAIYHYLLVLIFHILSMSFISVEVLIIFRHFPSKSALQTKSAWEAGSQDPTFSEGSQIYHLKCFYTSKMKRSLFSVLLHNDESYYWALLEPGRLHLPTSLSLRPWGWWQRPAGKFSWLTNLYSPDIHYQLDFLDQENSVILSTIYSPLSWITGCLAKKYSGDHSIASQKYLETTWWDLL